MTIPDGDCMQESFTLEKYVEKLAQLNPETGLGPLHKNKDGSTPFDPEVGTLPCLFLEEVGDTLSQLCGST